MQWSTNTACYYYCIITMMFTAGGCSEGAIRLAGGNTAREGRVQTCHGGVWGAVCREGGGQWMNTDADIVCRQLGYQEPDERGMKMCRKPL